MISHLWLILPSPVFMYRKECFSYLTKKSHKLNLVKLTLNYLPCYKKQVGIQNFNQLNIF